MKIGIDARFLGPEGTGIGRYTEELLNGLGRIDHANEYIVFLRKNNFDLFKPPSKNFKKSLCDARWYTMKEQILFPRIIKKHKIDLMHFCHFNIPILYSGNFVVTIHDLIKDEYGGMETTTKNPFVYYFKYFVYKQVIRKAIKKSKAILVPSAATKEKIVSRFKVPNEKVNVTYEAVNPKFFNWQTKEISSVQFAKVKKKYGIKKPFLLYVGNAYPYKNVARLLEALKLLKQDVQLVNPCARSAFYEKLKGLVNELRLSRKVVLPGFVPDSELMILYRKAELYVFPSLSEGFGLPPLEAQASGVAVAASRIEPITEICGDAAIYFNPYSVKDIADKISKVLESRELKNKLIKRGFKNIKRFSWQETAAKTLEVYEKYRPENK